MVLNDSMSLDNMRVLFLYPNQRSVSLVPPSIGLFSRLLKDRGAKVDLFDTSLYNILNNDSDLIDEENLTVHPVKFDEKVNYKTTDVYGDLHKRIEQFQPNLLAVTSTENTFSFALDLLQSIKNKNFLTIMGGVFPTCAPEKVIKCSEIDLVCVGEGEKSLVELCSRINDGLSYNDISNLIIKNKDNSMTRNSLAPPVNLDENPPLDLGIFEKDRLRRMMGGKMYTMVPVETHRGCPYGCTFCNSPIQNAVYREQTNKLFFRKKSIPKVREEIEYYVKFCNPDYVFFWADTFMSYSEKETDEFCEMYSDFRLPFYCQARPETITRSKIVKLKNVGLERIGVGIEHGNEEFRKKVLHRVYSNKQAIDSMKIVRELGISFSLNNIIGFPDETSELAMHTIELNRQISGFEDSSCSIFQPYHGTPLRQLAIIKGYLNPDVICSHNSDDSVLEMPAFSKEAINGIQRTFSMYIRLPKDRWPEIKLAEKLTPEGNEMWEKLRQELLKTYFT